METIKHWIQPNEHLSEYNNYGYFHKYCYLTWARAAGSLSKALIPSQIVKHLNWGEFLKLKRIKTAAPDYYPAFCIFEEFLHKVTETNKYHTPFFPAWHDGTGIAASINHTNCIACINEGLCVQMTNHAQWHLWSWSLALNWALKKSAQWYHLEEGKLHGEWRQELPLKSFYQ